MMDRNYPTPTFTDPLAPASSAAWAYERSAPGIKPSLYSLSYGAGHPSHSETDLLHRQTYAATHQLPAYATAHHPTGLSGLFDTGLHVAGGNTTETSVMNFLSAIESRTAQAASSGTTLLPQFRAPSWQTGMHSSAATELFVTGALQTSGTFPTSALSAYQHPNTFSSRNFATTPSLSLQDGTFSATTNGLLSHHDPLLSIKTSQTPLTFERLGSAVLSTSIPQSSTYRSAQESAPHLMQPQFSLLPTALGGTQQTAQPYSTSVFTGSTASIERALQRECSVIKHHQRPSSTQSVQAQLSGTQHSLPNYLSATGADAARQSALLCAPLGALTQVSNGGPVQKTPQVSVELSQSYPSAIPSPGFPPSSTKAKNCPTKAPPRSSKTPKSQSVSSPGQTQSYTKPPQSQSSVISSQAQAFSTAQLSSLLPVSQSPIYVSIQSPNLPSASQSQVFSTIKSEKLPPLYKPLTAYSSQSQTITSNSQTLSYSSDQQPLALSSVSSENYSDQTRELSSASQTQSYSSSNTQGLTPVSQSQVSYSSQSQVMSPVSPSDSYNSGQNLPLASPSLPFSPSSRGQTMSASSPTQNYISMHSSQNTQDSTSPQSQKFLPTVPSPSFASPSHSQTLQNRTSADSKAYVKRKSDTNLYASVKQEDKFQIQDLQALQQQTNMESTTSGLSEGEMDTQESVYSVSKADDRYSQSVIKSNSRIEDQVLGMQGPKKDERMLSPTGHMSQHIGHINNPTGHDATKSTDLAQPTQVSPKDLSQQHNMMHKVHEAKHPEQPSTSPQLQAVLRHPQHLQLPGAQVLLDSDLQMFQQSILQSTLAQAKSPAPMQRIQSPQQVTHQFLQMDEHIIQSNGGQPQQSLHSQGSDVVKMDTSDGKHLQQHLQGQRARIDSKNQFDSLNPMCFSETMLLGDERNFLSHVDDILAATAAQEFAKSSSDENMSVKSEDSKSRFQSLNIRNMPTNFTASKPQQNLNTLSLNGGQTAINLSTVSTPHSKNVSIDQNRIQPLDQDLPSGMGSPVLGSSQDDHEKNSDVNKKQESKDTKDVSNDGRDSEFMGGTKSLNEEDTTSGGDFIMGQDENATVVGQLQSPSQHMSNIDPQGSSGQMDESCQDLAQDGFQKNKVKDKMPIKQFAEDENANLKQVKRNVQMKRPMLKGPDVQFSSHVSEGYYDTYQNQERMRQKIKEVEEKQPEVKTGFIASFLDFLKTGPKQQFSAPAVRVPNRIRRPCTPAVKSPCPGPVSQTPPPAPVVSEVGSSPPKKPEEEVKKNLEALPSFSSDDDDDSVRGNNDLQKSISTALSALDENGEKRNKTAEQAASTPKPDSQPVASPKNTQDTLKEVPSEPILAEPLAKSQESIAVEGYTDDEGTESGGEGVYRERDEFVVKIEDIEMLKEALLTGKEPPAIWKVQKALLQKFIPEIRDEQRTFAATNSYLGYFGDAKTKYKRVYVKFVENANKKEYVRVCSRKPKAKATPAPSRTSHSKVSTANKAATDTPSPKTTPPKVVTAKPKAKQPKTKAEPPPKKRKQWKEEFSSSQSDSSPDMQSDEEEFEPPPPPIITRFLNTRTMKETFKGYVELLVGVALDAETVPNLEKDNDEVLLPHMRKIEGMITEHKRRVVTKLQLEPPMKNYVENYPDMTTINREVKVKSVLTPVFKIKVYGKWYNKKTMRPMKTPRQSQEFIIEPEKSQLYLLYHALHHYKYHIYLVCKDEVTSVQKSNRDLQQVALVNQCLKKMKWVEELFEKFGELLTRVQQTCS
ncbi:glutamine and serine-rich protein 1 isoform X1 [Rana temporaria]|uniref:glutamine and serine-rich protein 1 isoform X1 n=1 Tax=Rana temporaria TaxID=8407 RepID=UPI001AAD8B92|nr:glutamine and serine-rich protein 1 isoform X1 [Rana temporaria]